MGWLYVHTYKNAKTADLIREHYTEKPRDDKPAAWGVEYLSMRGNVGYAVMWYQSNAIAHRHYFGAVILTSRARSTMGNPMIGFKDMSEDMMPYYYDAPAKMLDMLAKLAPNAPYAALEWREKCRAHIAAKKTRAKLKPGDYVQLNTWKFKLLSSAGARRGFRVIRSDGTMWRMNARQAARAIPCEAFN